MSKTVKVKQSPFFLLELGWLMSHAEPSFQEDRRKIGLHNLQSFYVTLHEMQLILMF